MSLPLPDARPSTALARPMPRPTAQVDPFVAVLGAELAVQFLLQFGGAELYLAKNPKGRSAVSELVGHEKARALAESDGVAAQRRIPLAKRWLATMLSWQGHSTAHIARTLRVTDSSVRKWLKEAGR